MAILPVIIKKIFIMRIKLVQRFNPLDRNQAPKYYAHMENEGVVDLDGLSNQITKYSSLSLGDVSNVLENMVDAASLYLLMGRGVRIGRLGMFRIVLKSKGVNTPEEFNYNLINRVKLRFTPHVQMKKQLQDISYEMIK